MPLPLRDILAESSFKRRSQKSVVVSEVTALAVELEVVLEDFVPTGVWVEVRGVATAFSSVNSGSLEDGRK